MKQLAILLVLGLSFLTIKNDVIQNNKAQIDNVDYQKVLKIFEGVVYGIVEDIPEIGDCITGAYTAADDFYEAVQKLRQGGASNIEAGLKLIGQGIKQIPDIMEHCKAIPEEIGKIKEMIASFTNPWTFAYHVGKDILINGRNIYSEVEDAISAFDGDSWFRFGQDIGEILEQVFLGNQIMMKSSEDNIDFHKVLKIFEGVVYGIVEDIPEIGDCITGAVSSAEDFYNGIEKIKAGGASNVEAGLKLLGEGIKDIPGILKHCKAIPEEIATIEKLIGTFSNPWTFVFHVGKDILINGRNIYQEVEDAVSSYESQSWFAFGEDIGQILEQVFIGNQIIMKSASDNVDYQKIIKIFGGVIYGIVEDIPDIGDCITGAVSSAEDFYNGIEKIKAGGASNVEAGLKLLGEGIKEIPTILKNCKAVPEEIATIEKLIATFSNPWTFVFHVGKDILVNGRNIFNEVEDAITSYDSQNWFKFGEDIGNVLEQVFIGNQLMLQSVENFDFKDILKIFEGVIYGIVEDIPEIGDCVTGAISSAEDFYKGIEKIKAGGASNVEAGLKLLGEGVKAIPGIMKNCKAIPEEIETIEKLIKTFSNPWTFVFHVGKDILVNGRNIYHEVENAISSYENADWFKFGEDIGNILEQVFIGNEIMLTESANNNIDYHIVLKVFEGVVYGIVEDIPDIGDCITGAITTAKDFYQAVKDLKAGGASNVKDGLKLLAQGIKPLPGIIKSCKAIPEEVKKIEELVATFSNPWTFAFHVGKDILINGRNIYHEVENAISSYESQNWFAFGEDMGEILEQVFIGNELMLQTDGQNDAKQVLKIFEGVVYGIVEDIPEIGDCITGAYTAADDFYEAVQKLRQGGASNIEAGLKLIGQGIEQIPDIMEHCKAIPEEIGKIREMIASFTNPWTFAYHVGKDILINGRNIYSEVEDAISSYEGGSWFNFGSDIGQILEQVFLGNEAKLSTEVSDDAKQVLKIFEGVVYGIVEDIPEIGDCITGAYTAADDFYEAVQKLRQGGASNIEAGLKLIGQGIEQIPDIMEHCKAIPEEIGKIREMIASFTNPWTFAYHVGKDILINGRNIYSEVEDAISSYEGGSWFEFGSDIGQILEQVFLGNEIMKQGETY